MVTACAVVVAVAGGAFSMNRRAASSPSFRTQGQGVLCRVPLGPLSLMIYGAKRTTEAIANLCFMCFGFWAVFHQSYTRLYRALGPLCRKLAMFCYVFPFELRESAWAEGSCSITVSANQPEELTKLSSSKPCDRVDLTLCTILRI